MLGQERLQKPCTGDQRAQIASEIPYDTARHRHAPSQHVCAPQWRASSPAALPPLSCGLLHPSLPTWSTALGSACNLMSHLQVFLHIGRVKIIRKCARSCCIGLLPSSAASRFLGSGFSTRPVFSSLLLLMAGVSSYQAFCFPSRDHDACSARRAPSRAELVTLSGVIWEYAHVNVHIASIYCCA